MKLADVLDWFGFSSHAPAAGHHHSHVDEDGHGHTHGVIDPTIASTERGIWAIKWSFILLVITAVFQIVVVAISGSVALLADTIHNFADATTAIPLWVAFRLARRKPTETFTYGYGRVRRPCGHRHRRDHSFQRRCRRLRSHRPYLPSASHRSPDVGCDCGLIGFIGNEAVAVFRIRVGREINSTALIADGYHARTDGLTSLAVVAGATGVWLGFPLADPIVGLLITIAIFGIVWQSAKSVLTRMLDGVEPGLVAEIRHAAEHVKGIRQMHDVKARWLGHKLHTDVAILIDGGVSMIEADKISAALKKELFAHIPTLTVANVRVHSAAPETVAPQVADHKRASVHHHAPEPFQGRKPACCRTPGDCRHTQRRTHASHARPSCRRTNGNGDHRPCRGQS